MTKKNFQIGLADDQGQAMVEYAFILGLIAAVCILTLTAIGTNVNAILEAVAGIGGF